MTDPKVLALRAAIAHRDNTREMLLRVEGEAAKRVMRARLSRAEASVKRLQRLLDKPHP